MKTFLINFALLGSSIGFVTYLLIITFSFFSCCAGVDTMLYHKIIIGLVALSTIILGVCMYNNCNKHLKNP